MSCLTITGSGEALIDQYLLQDYLNTLGLPMEVYINLFPEETQYEEDVSDIQNAITFSLKTTNNNSELERSNLRFLIRSNSLEVCVATGKQLIKELDMKTNVILGDTQIVLFKATDKYPLPLGVDNNRNHVYQVDINVLASPIN